MRKHNNIAHFLAIAMVVACSSETEFSGNSSAGTRSNAAAEVVSTVESVVTTDPVAVVPPVEEEVASPPVPPPAELQLIIEPIQPEIYCARNVPLRAILLKPDGSKEDVTGKATWQLATQGVVEANAATKGSFVGKGIGEAEVSVTLEGTDLSASQKIKVIEDRHPIQAVKLRQISTDMTGTGVTRVEVNVSGMPRGADIISGEGVVFSVDFRAPEFIIDGSPEYDPATCLFKQTLEMRLKTARPIPTITKYESQQIRLTMEKSAGDKVPVNSGYSITYYTSPEALTRRDPVVDTFTGVAGHGSP